MTTMIRAARRGAATLMLLATGACASGGSGGGISDILGAVLGGGAAGGAGAGGSQVSGVVRGVDTRAQQIGLQLSNGQTVGLSYDAQTKVVYNNQSYAVTALDAGDQVTARVQTGQNNTYYTDLVQVDQPVQNNTGGTTTSGSNANVQSVQGTVRQIDATNGLFTLNTSNGTVTVSLPYNVSRTDQSRFQSLRAGDTVRLYGVYLNNTRVELRQFY